jgi:soluble lytic murein transglycosylase-like protein
MKQLFIILFAGVAISLGTTSFDTSARAEDMRMEVESSSKAQKRNSFRREYRQSPRASRTASRHERRKPLAANPHPYGPMIASYAATHGVPIKLADAMVRIESRYNPRARNGANLGLTQISYPTAKSLGYSGSPAGLYEPSANLNYGIKYLAQAYKLAGGDTCRAIMKYQSGHRAVSMNGANRAYCAKVRTVMANY